MNRIISEIIQNAQLCWDKGWSERNAGNFSINITNSQWLNSLELYKVNSEIPKCKFPLLSNQSFLISNANSKFRDIAVSPKEYVSILKISSEGNTELFSIVEYSSEVKPTSELETHLAVQNAQIEIGNEDASILHTHPTALIALSHLVEAKDNEKIVALLAKYYPELAFFLPEGIGLIPYLTPGSSELAIKTAENSKKFRLNIWERHGCISVANSLTEAFDLIDIAEKSAMVYFLACK